MPLDSENDDSSHHNGDQGEPSQDRHEHEAPTVIVIAPAQIFRELYCQLPKNCLKPLYGLVSIRGATSLEVAPLVDFSAWMGRGRNVLASRRNAHIG